MKCAKCNSDGPFYERTLPGQLAYGYCKTCSCVMSKELCKEIGDARKAGTEKPLDVTCRICRQTLPSTEFSPNQAASAILGFMGACKPCLRPLERAKWQRRKEKLSPTPDDYSDLV